MENFSDIQKIVLDVDGVLTNGRIYMGGSGESFKAFNAQDGLGISLLNKLNKLNHIEPIILTGRESQIVLNRMKELGVKTIFQNIKDKKNYLINYLNSIEPSISLSNILYMGDDLPDVPLLKACGLPCCPANAHPWVKEIVQNKNGFISQYKGGKGAVREVIDHLIQNYYSKEAILNYFDSDNSYDQ